MKKTALIAILLAAFAPVAQVWAFGTTYYSALKAQVSSNSSGMGKVYAGTSNSAPSASSYKADYLQSSSQSSSTENASKTFYAFAQAIDGYEFVGWSDSDDGSNTSTANPYEVAVNCSSTSSSSPTLKTVYANFKEKTKYAVTLAVPDLSAGFGSYTVTGPGVSGSGLASGGTLQAYYDGTYTFACTLSDSSVYEFVKWTITDSNGTTESTTSTLSKTFSSAATVKAVLREKAKYEVTLAVPDLSAGFGSYTVTGPGVSGSGLASGGTLQAYYDGTYTFACTLSDDEIYEFVKWEVTDSNGTTEYPESTLSKQFSAAATVTAVLNKKAEYQLTLVKPAGVNSYTVTGASGLSSGGTVTLHGATTCTFDYALDDDYKFVKWTVTDENGTTDHTEQTLTQTFASSDVTVSAIVSPKETYELTLVKPAGVEAYNVTVSGSPVSISSAGKATVRELDTYTFGCTIDAVQYAFVKWTVTDSSGTTEITEPTFTRTFSSAATVTAVLYKKGVYELTFVKPDEVTSYTITGPNGAVSISAEGKATVYELDSYTIGCEYDDDNYEIVEWSVTTSSGTTASPESPLTRTFTSDATVTVTLIRLESYIATCLPVPSGCSYKVGSETVTTAEKSVRGPKGQPMTLTMSAASAGSGYIFAGWYIDNGDGSKTYLSKASSETRTFEENVTIGADFVSSSSSKTALVVKASGGFGEYDDLQEAFSGLEAGVTA